MKNEICTSIDDLKNHILLAHHVTVIYDDILNLITEAHSISNYTGLNITEEKFINENNDNIFEWYCCAPGCNICGQSLTEYIRHQEDAHNDKYINLDPLWAIHMRR